MNNVETPLRKRAWTALGPTRGFRILFAALIVVVLAIEIGALTHHDWLLAAQPIITIALLLGVQLFVRRRGARQHD